MKLKKLISLFMVLCLLLTFMVSAAEDADVKVMILDQYVQFDAPPVIRDARTLVPVRAVFEALGCDVYWLDDLEIIIIVKNDTKLLMKIGYEDFYKFTGSDFEQFRQQVLDDNRTNIEEYRFEVPVQIIGERTLVPIRAICEAMGVNVSWENESETVVIACSNDFILDNNTDKTFAQQAFEFFRALKSSESKDDENSSKYDVEYEDGNLNILVDLNIIDKEDLDKDTYITNLEVLETLRRIIGYDEERRDLSEWYRGDALAPLDYLDDTKKGLLLDLLYSGKNKVITQSDILNMKFDENTTNYEVLIYVTRLIGDTYDCTDYPVELDFTEKTQTYNMALKKGIISKIDIESADLPIARKDFYEILHKAIFVERSIGGYESTSGRYVDSIKDRNERNSQTEEEIVVYNSEIPIEAVINDDMSISWTLPDKYQYFMEMDYFTDISTITNDGVIQNRSVSARVRNHISTTELIQFISGSYPEKLDYIRCIYYKYDNSYRTKEEWSFDIDISSITMLIAGEEIKPGVFTRLKRQWIPESISLADGQEFEQDSYYLLTSYDHTYRKPEYNSVSRAIFKADKTCDTYLNPGNQSFGVGGIYLDEIHIQQVMVTGYPETGFVLHVTPESKEIFTVVEGN